MRMTVQRVREASVSVDGRIVSQIGRGLLIYLGCAKGDCDVDARFLAEKAAGLRVFADEQEKMNRSVVDVAGEVLVISAFTLQADARKGRRPSFDAAATADEARPLCERFVEYLRAAGLRVSTGSFGDHMLVGSVNDGPICVLLDSKRLF